MNCPACSKKMTEQDFGGVFIDVCRDGCKGLWFDWLELTKLDEKNEGFGDALAEALTSPRINDSTRGQLKCPKCGVPMREHLFKKSRAVNVDECYNCGGFFLDSGELFLIREGYMTDAEHAAYIQELLDGIPGLKEYEKDLEKRYVRAKAALKATRFIRPSYLVPTFITHKTPAEDIPLTVKTKLKQFLRDENSIRSPEMRAYLDRYVVMLETSDKLSPELKALKEELGEELRKD